MTINIDFILFLIAVICFLLDAFRNTLKLETTVQFTPLGFACIATALWLV
jgi:hypothetical protein